MTPTTYLLGVTVLAALITLAILAADHDEQARHQRDADRDERAARLWAEQRNVWRAEPFVLDDAAVERHVREWSA